MRQIRESIRIRADRATVFAAYVNQIDLWWPRNGTYRYSFAPSRTEPAHIHFEPGEGGRLYEIFADGTEYEVGRITGWEPPERLSYTWRDPRWSFDSRVLVTFTEHGGHTTVAVTHSGFPTTVDPTTVEGYGVGLREILAAFGTLFEGASISEGDDHG